MKKIALSISLLALLAGCGSTPPPPQNNVTIQNNTQANFDVNKLAAVVKSSTDPAALEKAINTPATGINNLDLDGDGNVDYLKVVESDPNHLQVVDDVAANQSVTVANINITPNVNQDQQAELHIMGNPEYVGANYRYRSTFSFTDFLLMAYLLHPHHYYVPVYHYGYYPSYYSHTRVVTRYHSVQRPVTSYGRSYTQRSYNRSSLSSPSRSQRSFSTRSSSSPVRSGGFGRRSSSSGYSSFGSSSSSRSFGGSSRSFGSSRSSGFGRRR